MATLDRAPTACALHAPPQRRLRWPCACWGGGGGKGQATPSCWASVTCGGLVSGTRSFSNQLPLTAGSGVLVPECSFPRTPEIPKLLPFNGFRFQEHDEWKQTFKIAGSAPRRATRRAIALDF